MKFVVTILYGTFDREGRRMASDVSVSIGTCPPDTNEQMAHFLSEKVNTLLDDGIANWMDEHIGSFDTEVRVVPLSISVSPLI